jgi:hypothetical protein
MDTRRVINLFYGAYDPIARMKIRAHNPGHISRK